MAGSVNEKAAKIALKRRKKAEKEAAQKKNAGMSPTIRRQPEDLGRRQTSALLPPRFSRRQRADFFKVSRSATCRNFVFAPASTKGGPIGLNCYVRFLQPGAARKCIGRNCFYG